ncbi:hypothetical protein C0J52_26317 [Blattella germanica]|nr:hypothetical protein C0J52_26317 [Blattella germanica]
MFTSNQLLELMAQIMGAFQEIFNKARPRRATLLDWERRAFAFGSVKDSGRKKTREETCAGVASSIEQSPTKFDTKTICGTRYTKDNNARSHENKSEESSEVTQRKVRHRAQHESKSTMEDGALFDTRPVLAIGKGKLHAELKANLPLPVAKIAHVAQEYFSLSPEK